MTYKIGLISDTHMPQRWNELHPSLTGIFEDVDLITHAGDLGELWVLDKLSAIAPTVAVHGNDDTCDAIEHLPLTQLIAIAGVRILVWHSHFEDRVDEMESRRPLEMRPKLERIARYGQRVGAQVVHFGHWHIPLQCEIEGVRLVNAGGIASGNFACRQVIQTVAVMEIDASNQIHINHFNLADGRPYSPANVAETDFSTASAPYIGSILDDRLETLRPRIWSNPLLNETLIALAPRCWWGGQEKLRTADFLVALEAKGHGSDVEEALAILD